MYLDENDGVRYKMNCFFSLRNQIHSNTFFAL